MLNKKNILIVTCSYPPDLGGSGIVVQQTVQSIQKKYNIIVFAGGTKEEMHKDSGVLIYRNYSRSFEDARLVQNYNRFELEKKLQALVKQHNIDIIHFHSIQGLGANLIKLSLQIGLKTFLTMHDFWWSCPFLFLCDEFQENQPIHNHIKYCSTLMSQSELRKRQNYLHSILNNDNLTIFTVSQFAKKVYQKLNLPRADRYQVLENGIQKIPFISIKKPSKKTIFGYFGGENKSKGFDILLKAISLLRMNTQDYEVHIYAIHRSKLKSLLNFNFIKKHNIKLFPPYEHSMFPGILNSIDVVVHPSRMIETFSLVVHQALQYNIPVISSNMGAVGEIFCNHHITFSSQNSAELAERMYEVVNNKKYTNIERKDMNLFSSINKHSQKLLSYYEK